MSKLYENKIGPAGLPIGIGSKGAELPIGIGSKGNTVQLPEDGNPFDSLVLNHLKPGPYDRLNASIDDLYNRPGSYPDSLNNVNNISTDEIASLTEEKRTVEERIAVLKEKIQIQRNLKDAEDSPLMEIALHRFKAYGDPSGLNDIANRKQTRDMAEENMKYSRDMADTQKAEAAKEEKKAKEYKLGETDILAQNAKAALDDARKQYGTDSAEYKNAVREYRLPRFNVIRAAEATGDKKLIEAYKSNYPEVEKLSTTPPGDTVVESGGTNEDNVSIEDKYRQIAKDPKKSAHDIAKELVGKGKIKDMASEKWIPLKNELNDTIKARYEAEVKAYKAYNSKLAIYDLFEKRKRALEAYNKNKTKANRDVFRVIDNNLEKLGVKVEDYTDKGYPKPNVEKEPKEPTEYLD